MKIAIISDTHDRLDNIELALNYINAQDCKVLIHAGDLALSETLEFIADRFHGEIYIVEGNADLDPEITEKLTDIYPELQYFKKTAELEIGGLKIAVTHKPVDAKKLAGPDFDLVIHGHDHKPWQSFVGKCEILNPGNLSDRAYPATFAIYDTVTRKPKLIILNSLNI